MTEYGADEVAEFADWQLDVLQSMLGNLDKWALLYPGYFQQAMRLGLEYRYTARETLGEEALL